MLQGKPQTNDVIFIVDDDLPLSEMLKHLFRSVGLQAETFGSVKEFLQAKRPNVPSCLIPDTSCASIAMGLANQASGESHGTQSKRWDAAPGQVADSS